jgi:hypothetical protein
LPTCVFTYLFLPSVASISNDYQCSELPREMQYLKCWQKPAWWIE